MSGENTVLTSAQKKYLLAIYALCENKGSVRSADVADFVGVTRASTVKMAKRLIDGGFINKQPYGSITLTERGIQCAKPLFEKYEKLRAVLENEVGVPAEKAAADAAAIVAHISDGLLKMAHQ